MPAVYDGLREKIMRREILGERPAPRRPRASTRSATITSEVGVLPRTHGSALFTRGETQALVTVTLGTSEDAQIIDTVQEPDHKKRFMLHYNFPPFSVGEVKFLRGPGRREIGHGALAERSLREMLPDRGEPSPTRSASSPTSWSPTARRRWPRSAAAPSPCMDAGVPIKAPGGRRGHGPGQGRRPATPILTDIAGVEDHYGDMDFKVAGTRDGHHRPADGHQDRRHHAASILSQALEQARAGRLHILGQDGRGARRSRAPSISTLRAAHPHDPDPGGQDPRHHRARRQDDPLDRRAHRLQDRRRGRRPRVDRLRRRGGRPQGRSRSSRSSPPTAELNKTYLGKVVRVVDFGAFVEILPGTDGLLHVSEMAAPPRAGRPQTR